MAVALVIVAATLFVFWLDEFGVSGDQLTSLFRIFDWRFLPLFLALLITYVALSSWRWSLIERALSGARPNFRRAMMAGVFALGLGTFLPSPLVNVACRSLSNRLIGASAARGAVSGGIDLLSDLLVISIVAVPALGAFVTRDIDVYLFGAPIAILACGCAVFFTPDLFRSVAGRVRLPQSTSALFEDRRLLMQIYSISVMRIINLTLLNLAIHFATGSATIGAVAVSVPLAAIAIAAVMLPGGIGVSEWSFSAVLSGLGVASNDIVLFVLANRIAFTGLSLAMLLIALVLAGLRMVRSSEANDVSR